MSDESRKTRACKAWQDPGLVSLENHARQLSFILTADGKE